MEDANSVTSPTTTPHRESATVEALVNAIEAAGSTDPQKVRDALAKVSFDSLYGRSPSMTRARSACRRS